MDEDSSIELCFPRKTESLSSDQSSEIPFLFPEEGSDNQHNITFLTPGKTFLLGEYAALYGSPALIACTKPYFELSFPPKIQDTHQSQAIHPQSPAGHFLADKFQDTHNFNKHFSWHVPLCYQTGGFGASTAEFLSVYQYYLALTHQNLCLDKLYTDYLKYAFHGEGVPPSGYDLIAQTQSQLVWIEKSLKSLNCDVPGEKAKRGRIFHSPQSYSWPFSDWHLLLFKTPIKLPTHEHLATLKPLSQLTLQKLKAITQIGREALENSDINQWLSCINEYGKILQDNNLVAQPTLEYLDSLKSMPFPYAAKGCGALGADVLMLIVEKRNIKAINAWVKRYQLIQIASENEL